MYCAKTLQDGDTCTTVEGVYWQNTVTKPPSSGWQPQIDHQSLDSTPCYSARWCLGDERVLSKRSRGTVDLCRTQWFKLIKKKCK